MPSTRRCLSHCVARSWSSQLAVFVGSARTGPCHSGSGSRRHSTVVPVVPAPSHRIGVGRQVVVVAGLGVRLRDSGAARDAVRRTSSLTLGRSIADNHRARAPTTAIALVGVGRQQPVVARLGARLRDSGAALDAVRRTGRLTLGRRVTDDHCASAGAGSVALVGVGRQVVVVALLAAVLRGRLTRRGAVRRAGVLARARVAHDGRARASTAAIARRRRSSATLSLHSSPALFGGRLTRRGAVRRAGVLALVRVANDGRARASTAAIARVAEGGQAVVVAHLAALFGTRLADRAAVRRTGV